MRIKFLDLFKSIRNYFFTNKNDSCDFYITHDIIGYHLYYRGVYIKSTFIGDSEASQHKWIKDQCAKLNNATNNNYNK